MPSPALQPHANLHSPATPRSPLLRDTIAGLSVAVVELPQAMAYAIIAGVPPVYGIYTSVLQGGIGALLSGNRHVRTGPTNTQSLLVAACMSQFGQLTPAEYLTLVAALTFLKGIIQIIAGLLRAGILFRYVSPSTIVGLSAGAGLLIIAGQVPAFLGLHITQKSQLPGLLGIISSSLPQIADANIDRRAIAIGVCTLLAMVLLSRIHKLFPATLVAVSLATFVVFATGWSAPNTDLSAPQPIAVVGAIPHDLPHLTRPSIPLERITPLFTGALALALLGMIEAVAIARTLRDPTETTPSARHVNRELWAQGTANFLSSLVGAIPGSASFSRSALDVAAGAATRASGPISAAAVAILAIMLAPAGQYLPLAALAGVLMVIAVRLFDLPFFLRAYRNHRGDFLVGLITFLSTILLPLQFAVFIGIAANLLLQLRVASRLRITELLPVTGGRYRESELNPHHSTNSTENFSPLPIRVIQIDGNLFFALRDELDETLLTLAQNPHTQVVIFRLRNTLSIDISVVESLAAFVKQMHARNRYVIFCGLSPHLYQPLSKDPRFVPSSPNFPTLLRREGALLSSLTEALHYAHRYTGLPEPDPNEDPSAAWVYVV
jgi:SulP family sulfate permease